MRGVRFEPQTGPTLRVLKLLRRMCCLCSDICKWLDVLVLALAPASSLLWAAGDIIEPTHVPQRVGNEAPSVVVWSLSVVLSWLGWEVLGVLAMIKLIIIIILIMHRAVEVGIDTVA